MYLLSAIVTLVILSLFTFGGAGIQRMAYIIDLPSLLLPALICIPVLVFSGLRKDFLCAFRLVSSRNADASLHEKKRAREAVSLAMKTLFLSGGLITAYSLIMIMAEAARSNLYNADTLLAMAAVSLIPLFYTLFLNLFLLLLYGRLNVIILEHTAS